MFVLFERRPLFGCNTEGTKRERWASSETVLRSPPLSIFNNECVHSGTAALLSNDDTMRHYYYYDYHCLAPSAPQRAGTENREKEGSGVYLRSRTMLAGSARFKLRGAALTVKEINV
jgi:hypothetical protein